MPICNKFYYIVEKCKVFIDTNFFFRIPETPEEVEDSNISSLENLPVFSKLNSKTCSLIINKLAQQYDVGLWELNQYLINEKSETLNIFKHLFEPLEILSLPFLASWGVAKMLHFSNIKNMPSKFFYPLNNKLLDVRSDKFNSNAIYTTCKKLLENDAHKYSDEEKRILEKFVLEGFLNGLELDDNNKKNLSDCSITLDSKKKLYEQKLRLAKNHFKQIISDPKFAEDSPLDLLRYTIIIYAFSI